MRVQIVVVIVPVALTAALLAFAFFGLVLPAWLCGLVDRFDHVAALVLLALTASALVCLGWLLVTARRALRYLRDGEAALRSVTWFERTMTWSAPLVPVAWAAGGLHEVGLLFLPALGLLPPTLHLAAARWLAGHDGARLP